MNDGTLSPAAPPSKVKRQWIEATITRADGAVEHLGIISDTRLSWRLAQAARFLTTPLARIFRRDH